MTESQGAPPTLSPAQERDRKIRSLAHEILNCLHVVQLSTHSLATVRNDEAKLAEWLGIAENHRKRAVELVNELAAIARQQPGRRGGKS